MFLQDIFEKKSKCIGNNPACQEFIYFLLQFQMVNASPSSTSNTGLFSEVSKIRLKAWNSPKSCEGQQHQTHQYGYSCQFCKKEFKTKSNRRRHEQIVHLKILTHQCDQCNLQFGTREQLQGHQRSYHNLYRFCCPDCGKQFSYVSNLRAHQKICNNKEKKVAVIEHQCGTCGKVFSAGRYLKSHIKFMHVTRTRFICEICKEKLSCKSSLERHCMRKHQNQPSPQSALV